MKKKIVILLLLLSLLFSVTSFAEPQITADIPSSGLSYADLPAYFGQDVITIDENIPDFNASQLTTETFVHFSPFDKLGRTGAGFACLGPETLPTGSRSSIGNIQPSGWHTVRYDDLIVDHYLYNRSHIIGFLLCGDNATPENLFTGTRHLNSETMVKVEIRIAEYIESTGNHVLLRVTPIYNGKDLVATGVQMEALSVEDEGQGLCLNVFIYNVQPGIVIDYSTGDSRRETSELIATEAEPTKAPDKSKTDQTTKALSDPDYVLNTNTKKFHYPDCSSVKDIKPKNRQDFTGTRDEAIAMGYVPCKRCNP